MNQGENPEVNQEVPKINPITLIEVMASDDGMTGFVKLVPSRVKILIRITKGAADSCFAGKPYCIWN